MFIVTDYAALNENHSQDSGDMECLCDLTQGPIIFFLVKASLSKLLDVATSNFAGAYGTWCGEYWAMFCACLI